MEERKPIIAIYPGSFDPITLGHLNIIKRAATLFDKVIVCVMVNSAKKGFFTYQERAELIKQVLNEANITNVEVDCSNILLAEYAKKKNAKIIVRGLRTASDYESEVQMAIINNKINPELETIFLPSGNKYTHISSTIVKTVAPCGVELNEFMPQEIVGTLMKRIKMDEGCN